MSNEERTSFESKKDNIENVQSVKIDGKKSRYSRQLEKKQDFEKRAEDAQGVLAGRQAQAFDLSKKFIDIMEDKTLSVNKGPMQQSIEREVINKLIDFSVEVNNDVLEKEGMGSTGLIILLFRSLMIMRDKYNLMEYKMHQIEQQLKSSQQEKDVK
jgi:hypothetical protein